MSPTLTAGGGGVSAGFSAARIVGTNSAANTMAVIKLFMKTLLSQFSILFRGNAMLESVSSFSHEWTQLDIGQHSGAWSQAQHLFPKPEFTLNCDARNCAMPN